jgi:hypothetical protein
VGFLCSFLVISSRLFHVSARQAFKLKVTLYYLVQQPSSQNKTQCRRYSARMLTAQFPCVFILLVLLPMCPQVKASSFMKGDAQVGRGVTWEARKAKKEAKEMAKQMEVRVDGWALLLLMCTVH